MIQEFHAAFELIELIISPNTIKNVLIWASIFFGSGILFVWKPWKSQTVKRHIFSAVTIVVVPIIYCLVLVFIVPFFQSFDNDKFSILLANFGGARLAEYFDQKTFNEALESEIRYALTIRGLDSVVELRTISWIVDASDTSYINKLRNRYNASAAIWGDATKLDNGVFLRISFDGGEIPFVAVLPNGSDTALFHEIISKEYNLRMKLEDSSMAKITRNIIDEFTFVIAVNISDTHFALYEELLRKVPELKYRFHGHDYEPFLIQQAAFATARGGDTIKAMDLYNQSFNMFEHLKNSLDTSIQQNKNLIPKITRFSALSKYFEGVHAFNRRDFDRMINCFEIAMKTDTIFVKIISELEYSVPQEH